MPKYYTRQIALFTDLAIIFLMIFITPETVLFGTNANKSLVEMQKYFPVALFFIIWLKLRQGGYCTKHQRGMLFSFFGLLSLFIILSGIYNNNLIIGYGLRILLIGAGFLFVVAFPFDKFLSLFEKIIFVITLYSLFFFIVRIVFPPVLNALPVVRNSMLFSFYNAGLCVIPTWSGVSASRLWGPFREPGVFQMYMNLALLFYIKNNTRLSFLKAIVYISAILLTLSTTGYVVLFFILLYYIFNIQSVNRGQKTLLIILLIIGFGYLLANTSLFSAEGYVFGKLFDEDSHSGIARMSSIYGNLSIFSSSPIFGVGITRLPDLFASYCFEHYSFANTSNTSTILVQFSMFGLLFGTIWLIAFISFFKSFSTRLLPIICSCLAGVIMFMGENLMENTLVYVLLGYGILNLCKRL